jgi:hypothetical protein
MSKWTHANYKKMQQDKVNEQPVEAPAQPHNLAWMTPREVLENFKATAQALVSFADTLQPRADNLEPSVTPQGHPQFTQAMIADWNMARRTVAAAAAKITNMANDISRKPDWDVVMDEAMFAVPTLPKPVFDQTVAAVRNRLLKFTNELDRRAAEAETAEILPPVEVVVATAGALAGEEGQDSSDSAQTHL